MGDPWLTFCALSGAAERFGHAFFGCGGQFQIGVVGILVKRAGQCVDQSMEGSEVILVTGLNGLLDAVVARNEDGIGRAHRLESGRGLYRPR